MGFFELLKLFLGLMPTIMRAVKLIEAAVPQKGAGPAKLAAVLSTVEAVALAAPVVVSSGADVKTAVKAGDLPNITKGLTHIIGSVVSLFNATGAFQKSGFVQGVTAAGNNDPMNGASGG